MSVIQDVSFGLRSLQKHRGLTLVSVGILTIGIGANTALFSVANSVLLRPVPGLREPASLVRVLRLQAGGQYSNFGYPDYLDYRDRCHTLAGLIAERAIPLSFSHGETERIPGAIVTGNYFAVLGVQPALGRLLTSQDDRVRGAHPVAVISGRLWRRVFASDPAIAGHKMLLNGYAFTIVGVAAPEFHGLTIGANTDVWVPMMMQHEAMPRYANVDFLSSRSAGWLDIFGRLAPGATFEQAAGEIASIAKDLARQYPDTNRNRAAAVTRDIGMDPDQRRDLLQLFGLLLASVGLLLLIACENIANLFLTRAAGRRREMAIRLALGAGRWQLVRQLLTESLLVCTLAATLGLLLAPFTVKVAMQLLQPADIALRAPVSIDATVLLFTLSLVLFTAVLFGLAPAIQASKTDVLSSLKASAPLSGRSSSGKGPNVGMFLVAGQVAIAAVLLIASGLVLQSMIRIMQIHRGFQTDRVLLAAVDLAIQRYSDAQGLMFGERFLQRMQGLPGVESVSLSKSEPARDWSDRTTLFYPGHEASNGDPGLLVDANRVSPGYFRTLGIPLLVGRDFTIRDRQGTPRVAIISGSLANLLWPGENAIGKHLSTPPLEVVGVASDARYRSVVADPPLLLYQPLLQNYDSLITIEVRTRSDPAAFASTLRHELAAEDSNLALYNVRTFSGQVNGSLWQQRTTAVLIAVFGLVSLTLSSVGLYSELAHSVAIRTREIGIRMALGADAGDVRRTIVRQGLLLTALGGFAGVLLAIPLARLASSSLYGVSAADPPTFAIAIVLLLLLSIPASYLPARSATRIDPMSALRDEV